MHLQDATEADLPSIVAIYNQTIPGRMVTADTDPVSVESRLPWFRAHNSLRRPLLVARDQDVTVGWVSFNSFYGRPAYDRTAELSIYVDAAHRRQGVGRWILTQAIERAPGHQIDTLLGFIFGHNEPSLRLFEKFSFARWGHLPRIAVLDGIERDLVIVGRRL